MHNMTAMTVSRLAGQSLHPSSKASADLCADAGAFAPRTFTLAGIALPESAGLRRKPTRPPHLQDESFSEKFDDRTLFYDAVRSADGSSVRIIAPALLNLKVALRESHFFIAGRSEPCRFEITDLDRQSQIIVQLPVQTEALTLEGAIGRHHIPISADQSSFFAGRRVVFVQSKNNNLVWIRDWLGFYQKVHGADAVLFYDNGSSAYTPEQIVDTLSSVPGIERIVLVSWPFKHGPVGKGLKKYWDSDFSKLGMLEHARWRFLSQAKSALNCDIDELVVCRSNASIFARVEKSLFGIEAFRGSWIHAIDGLTRKAMPDSPLRFVDFRHSYYGVTEKKLRLFSVETMQCQPKWAVIPARTPPDAQWHVHQIKGWWPSRVMSRDVRFRHFREINTSWKYDRTIRDSAQAMRQVEDPLLIRDFVRAGWLD